MTHNWRVKPLNLKFKSENSKMKQAKAREKGIINTQQQYSDLGGHSPSTGHFLLCIMIYILTFFLTGNIQIQFTFEISKELNTVPGRPLMYNFCKCMKQKKACVLGLCP